MPHVRVAKTQESPGESSRHRASRAFWARGNTVTASCSCSPSSLLSLLCLLTLEKHSSFIVSSWWSIICNWMVAKRQQKCHHCFFLLATAEEWPRASMSAFFPDPFGEGVDVKYKVWNAITQLRVKHSSAGFLRFPCVDWLQTPPSERHYGSKLKVLWVPSVCILHS